MQKTTIFTPCYATAWGSGKDAAVSRPHLLRLFTENAGGGQRPRYFHRDAQRLFAGQGVRVFCHHRPFLLRFIQRVGLLYQRGSAPSYLARRTNLFKITSASAPVGIIKEVRAERISFSVEEGDCIIMFSDGVEDTDSPLITEENSSLQAAVFPQPPASRLQARYCRWPKKSGQIGTTPRYAY